MNSPQNQPDASPSTHDASRITNQAHFNLPPDPWYHLAPLGEFTHAESGLMQVLDVRALDSMVACFQADSRQPNFPGLLVDFEHFSYDPEKSSAAAGWITALEHRTDPASPGSAGASGLWAQIRWSDEGRTALEQGTYRLISPAWLPQDVERLDSQRIRPLRLDTAGLTNTPNLKGLVPLSNHRVAGILPAAFPVKLHQPANPDDCGAGFQPIADNGAGTARPRSHSNHRVAGLLPAVLSLPAPELTTSPAPVSLPIIPNFSAPSSAEPITINRSLTAASTKQHMTKINTALGLAPEASEDAALAAITSLTNRATGAEAKITALEHLNQELLAAQVETDLDQYAPRFKPEAREKLKTQLLANRTATLELLENLADNQRGQDARATSLAPLHNRANAKTPDANSASAEKEALRLKAVREYRNRTHCSFQEAWDGARQENPTLFAD